MADKAFANDVLKAHNNYRAHHNVAPLSLSQELSAQAQKWAQQLASTNMFQHSDSTFKGKPLGENVAMKWSSKPEDYKGQEVTDQWYTEARMYQYGAEPESYDFNHFTQIVWKDTKELGVGKSLSNDGKTIVVVMYFPAGNMMGEYTKNVLIPKDGVIVTREKASEVDGTEVIYEETRKGGRFEKFRPGHEKLFSEDATSSLFGTMNDNFFDNGSSPSFASRRLFPCAESKNYRTYTVVEGVGPNKVSKTITEEITTTPTGKRIVKQTETVNPIGGFASGNFSNNCGAVVSSLAGCADTLLPQPSKIPSKKNKSKTPFIESVIDAHNRRRAKHGVPDLMYSEDLTKYAQEWAEFLAVRDVLDHSPCVLHGHRLGESIACKWGALRSDFSGDELSDQWYSEKSGYDFESNNPVAGCGHFTQMVWSSSRHIGIGKAKSRDGKVIVVASYRPPGNVVGHYKENVFPPVEEEKPEKYTRCDAAKTAISKLTNRITNI